MPVVLVVVMLSTLISFLIGLEDQSVAVMGSINGGYCGRRLCHFHSLIIFIVKHCVLFFSCLLYRFDAPFIPDFTNVVFEDMISSIFTLAVLNFILTFVVVKAYAVQGGYSVSPNRELVALGRCIKAPL